MREGRATKCAFITQLFLSSKRWLSEGCFGLGSITQICKILWQHNSDTMSCIHVTEFLLKYSKSLLRLKICFYSLQHLKFSSGLSSQWSMNGKLRYLSRFQSKVTRRESNEVLASKLLTVTVTSYTDTSSIIKFYFDIYSTIFIIERLA